MIIHWKECFNEYVNKKKRIEFDSEDDKEPDDIEGEQESFQVTSCEVLAMINRLLHTSGISNANQNALFGITENIQGIVITQE